jgi:hypothetical protein
MVFVNKYYVYYKTAHILQILIGTINVVNM